MNSTEGRDLDSDFENETEYAQASCSLRCFSCYHKFMYCSDLTYKYYFKIHIRTVSKNCYSFLFKLNIFFNGHII